MMMRTINPKQVLVFYDEPILFTATDAVESLYLCLLSSIPDVYDCTAIRISHGRLTEYLSKRVDLRTVFTNPEFPGEYFRVTPDEEERLILSPLDEKDLTEDRLPEEGDYHNGETQTHKFPIQSATYPRPDRHTSWRRKTRNLQTGRAGKSALTRLYRVQYEHHDTPLPPSLTTKSPPKRAKTHETESALGASILRPLKHSYTPCSMNRASTTLTPKQCQ